jgi:hypothetical protein
MARLRQKLLFRVRGLWVAKEVLGSVWQIQRPDYLLETDDAVVAAEQAMAWVDAGPPSDWQPPATGS